MPTPSKIDALPSQIRAELDKRLIESGFGDHRGISEWLAEQGIEIGKSAIGKYAARMRDRLQQLSDSHNFAIAYGHTIAGSDGAVPRMLNGLTQDCLYKVIIKLHQQCSQLTDESDLWGILRQLSMVSGSLANVTRSDIAVAKYSAEMKARQEAKLAELNNEGQQLVRSRGVLPLRPSYPKPDMRVSNSSGYSMC